MKAAVTKGPASSEQGPRRVRRGNAEDHQRLSQQIIDTTFELYRAKGKAELKMRAIASRVGLSPMGMYRYFPSKARLLAALVHFVMAELDDHMVAALQRCPATPQARMRATIEATIAYWEAHEEHYRLVFLGEDASDSEAADDFAHGAALHSVVDRNLQLIIDYAEVSGGEPERAELALEVRRCMVYGYLHQTLVMKAVPVQDVPTLRRQMIEATLLCVDQCLAQPAMA